MISTLIVVYSFFRVKFLTPIQAKRCQRKQLCTPICLFSDRKYIYLYISTYIYVHVHVHCRDFNIFSSHGLLPSDLVAQSVERRRSNPKVVGSIPTLVRVFHCPCVGPFPSVGLTLTWFIWDRNRALHITHYSVNSV